MRRAHRLSQCMTALFVFTLLLFAGAAHAAAPDANVKGLWLKASAFPTDPKKVEVLKFEDDQKTGEVTYIRSLDGVVTLEIRRQKIEGSELQGPEDVEGLIEMRVNNDDINEKILEENRGSINVNTDAAEFAKRLTYPCATAEYLTGANEDTRKNVSLFIFTDLYCFEVAISLPTDAADEYAESTREWFKSLKLVEGTAKAASEKKKTADVKITGLWLEIPDFPEDVNIEMATDKEGMAAWVAEVDTGLILTILRYPNPNNALTTKNVAEFVSKVAKIPQGEVSVTVPDKNDRPFPAAEKYPFAAAECKNSDGNKEILNVFMLFFPKNNFFMVHVQAEDEEILAKNEADIERWFKAMAFVQK